jgi:hypothetical protein
VHKNTKRHLTLALCVKPLSHSLYYLTFVLYLPESKNLQICCNERKETLKGFFLSITLQYFCYRIGNIIVMRFPFLVMFSIIIHILYRIPCFIPVPYVLRKYIFH